MSRELKRFDFVSVTKAGHPAEGMAGEITDVGPGEYLVAVDEVSKFFWFYSEDLEFLGSLAP